MPEIGIAGINLTTTEAFLFQFSDTANYPLIFHILDMLKPRVVIMSETCIDQQSLLYQAIEPFISTKCDIHAMERSEFNENAGLNIIDYYSIHVFLLIRTKSTKQQTLWGYSKSTLL